MITGDHSRIRLAEADDAPFLYRCYQADSPRAALLDKKREPIHPTTDELRALLSKQEAHTGAFYAVEDTEGRVRGMCSIRGANAEAAFGEASVWFLESADFDTPLANEAARFLAKRAFTWMRLNKLIVYCFVDEEDVRDLLLRNGFASNGVHREACFTRGRYHDLETFSRFAQTDPLPAPRS